MKIKKLLSSTLTVLLAALIMAGCDTTNTSDELNRRNVKIQFKTVTSSSKALSSSSVKSNSEHDSLAVDGNNGSLQIDDIRFIVEKFKFEFEDEGCEDTGAEEGDDCEEFEAEPFFVDLPLDEDILSLANDQIGTGLYKKLEFEVKDLDFENEEEGDDQEHLALADSVRAQFPDWPEEASMVLVGSFTPNGGDPQPFKVFAKAEIEIEKEFEPHLEVTEDNIQKVVSVRINPTRWLLQADGSVLDLTQYDWNQSGELLEFSAKFKDGVEEIEVEEEEFDD